MKGFTRGYFWSVLTMMAAPFLLISGAAFVIWRVSKNGVAAKTHEEES